MQASLAVFQIDELALYTLAIPPEYYSNKKCEESGKEKREEKREKRRNKR